METRLKKDHGNHLIISNSKLIWILESEEKLLTMITGYGILSGSNIQTGNLEMLVGLFQHMNFFDNKTFELGTIAFGPR